MQRHSLFAGAAGLALVAGLALPAAAETTLNVITAGSENMVEYVTDYLGPKFEAMNPGVRVQVSGTGPGDAGSQKIYEKLAAQQQAGAAQWDVDVAVVHQKMAGQMVEEDLLGQYRDDIQTGKLVTRDTAEKALGTAVGGFVMPMFHSQTAIAYNADLVPEPPGSYEDLKAWVQENPGQFGYNGIKNGMSGVAFVVGWIYADTGQADQLINGPYDEAAEAQWDEALADLKEFNQHVTLTPGNAGTLDMLNRGEIAMGPVWVDMFYTWQADGRVPPNVRLKLIEPGMPGQPMYYVTPSKASNPDLARRFIELATSPEVQAEGIVKQFNWYPGIDAEHIQAAIDEATWNKLFADVTPEELASKGQPFPIGPYFDDMLEAYEKQVEN
ncbi:MAG: transporter substrate-binding protein [Geminicoccaceae bacterium]|nr:transporter substrate-binding protein [Geminicoccaceae bacterium]